MAGVDVGEGTIALAPLRKKGSCELRALSHPVELAVELRAEFSRRVAGVIEGSKDGMDVGHQDGRRNSLAADVGYGESHAAPGPLQNVVVVSPNSSRGNTNGGELEVAVNRKPPRKKSLLHLESEVQFCLFTRQFVAAGSQFQLDSIKHHAQNRRRRGPGESQAKRSVGGHGEVTTAYVQQHARSHQENQEVDSVTHGWIQSDLSLKA